MSNGVTERKEVSRMDKAENNGMTLFVQLLLSGFAVWFVRHVLSWFGIVI